ncbi:MAG TPA: hypothetical protein VFQ89_08155, partial [Candidatus Binatia bacterium]|nr:hypothetical protein [Candidatus Binatia bacterium]
QRKGGGSSKKRGFKPSPRARCIPFQSIQEAEQSPMECQHHDRSIICANTVAMIECAGMGGATAIDSRIFTAGLLVLMRNSPLAEKFLVNLLERILGCGNAAFSPAVSANPNLFECKYSPAKEQRR